MTTEELANKAQALAGRIDALRQTGRTEIEAIAQAAEEQAFSGSVRTSPEDGWLSVFYYRRGICTDRFVTKAGEPL
jgi:hypothetical protein